MHNPQFTVPLLKKRFVITLVMLYLIGMATAQTTGTAIKGVSNEVVRSDAPSTYVVRQGDTLWGIAERFLNAPWQWERLWDPNRSDIPNPHLIYPGQVLKLEIREDGRTYLNFANSTNDNNSDNSDNHSSLSNDGSLPLVKISPSARLVSPKALPTVPLNLLEPFFIRSLIVDPARLQGNPRVISIEGGRIMVGDGLRFFVSGDLLKFPVDPTAAGRKRQHIPREYFVYRPSEPIIDPNTNKVLAYQSQYVGIARLDKEYLGPNHISIFNMVRNEAELRVGDFLVPRPNNLDIDFGLKEINFQIQGHIASTISGVSLLSGYSVVVLNRGAKDGLEVGHVLRLWKESGVLHEKQGKKIRKIALPALENGSLLVFRVFDNVAYALVTHLENPALVGDIFTSPL